MEPRWVELDYGMTGLFQHLDGVMNSTFACWSLRKDPIILIPEIMNIFVLQMWDLLWLEKVNVPANNIFSAWVQEIFVPWHWYDITVHFYHLSRIL